MIVSVNLAILMYARTATRHGEIAVRTALGASRRRIVGQLFIEALVLSAVAAGVGLLLMQFGLRTGHQLMQLEGGSSLPYWVKNGVPAAGYLYVAALTIGSAVISGVLPALRATGRRVQHTLRELGGSSGMRLGPTWTTLIVAQVALTVAGLPMAISHGMGRGSHGHHATGLCSGALPGGAVQARFGTAGHRQRGGVPARPRDPVRETSQRFPGAGRGGTRGVGHHHGDDDPRR